MAFTIICLLIIVTPLLRGSVHAWAETLIQMCALTGVFCLLLDGILNNRATEKIQKQAQPEAGIENTSSKPKSKRKKKHKTPTPEIPLHITLAVIVTLSAFFSSRPSLSAQGISMLATYIAIYWIAATSVNTRKKQRILVYVILSTAVFISIIGLLKRFDMNPLSLWVYADVPRAGYTSLSGPYVNRNHMAGFLGMAIPMMIALFLTREHRLEIRAAMIGAALLLICTQVLTLSRGGWMATTGALVFMAVVLFIQKSIYRRTIVGISLLVLGVGVWALASTPVVNRLSTLTQNDVSDNLETRTRTWTGTLALIKAHPLTGSGPGTFSEAYPQFQIPGQPHLSVYAHNDYLHFVSDGGILMIPVILWSLFLLFRAGFKAQKSQSRQTQGLALGAMAGMVAIAIHSFSDFNLHIPANTVLFVVLAGTLMRIQNPLRR